MLAQDRFLIISLPHLFIHGKQLRKSPSTMAISFKIFRPN